jgi:hypothetical protein
MNVSEIKELLQPLVGHELAERIAWLTLPRVTDKFKQELLFEIARRHMAKLWMHPGFALSVLHPVGYS